MGQEEASALEVLWVEAEKMLTISRNGLPTLLCGTNHTEIRYLGDERARGHCSGKPSSLGGKEGKRVGKGLAWTCLLRVLGTEASLSLGRMR